MNHVIIFGMRALDAIFFIGLAGSAVVVLISFVEDFKELWDRDDKPRAARTSEAKHSPPVNDVNFQPVQR
jgi:hypothetical protein